VPEGWSFLTCPIVITTCSKTAWKPVARKS